MPKRDFDPAASAIGHTAGRGAVMTGAAQAVKVVTQMLSVVLLSRLLSPLDFGIIAMASPLLAFVALFQNLGLSQATIQKPSITHENVNFLYWINVGVSAVLAVLVAVVAPWVARFYGQPAVGPLVAAMSLPVLIQGLGTQHQALMTRRMLFGKLAFVDAAAAVGGLAVSVAWASLQSSYWALYGGTLTVAVLGTAAYWSLSGWQPGLPRRSAESLPLVKLGAGFTGFSFANFFARNVDNVLIGKYWGDGQLGIYDRAYKLLLFPLGQITNPLATVMVPSLSRMTHDPQRYRNAYLRVLPIVLMIALPGVAAATALSDILIPLVLGEKWRASAAIFRALGFAGLLQPLNNPTGWLFISQGRSKDFLYWGLFGALTAVVAFLIGLPYGALGVAVAYAASEYFRTPILWLFVCRKGPIRFADAMGLAMPFVLGAHLALGTVWALTGYLPHQPVVAILCGGALSYAIVVSVAMAFRSSRQAVVGMLSTAFAGLSPVRG